MILQSRIFIETFGNEDPHRYFEIEVGTCMSCLFSDYQRAEHARPPTNYEHVYNFVSLYTPFSVTAYFMFTTRALHFRVSTFDFRSSRAKIPPAHCAPTHPPHYVRMIAVLNMICDVMCSLLPSLVVWSLRGKKVSKIDGDYRIGRSKQPGLGV